MHEPRINQQIKRTAKDSLYYLPTKIIPAIVGIVLIRILTNVFTPAEYGYYQITLATFGLINVFTVIWLTSSVTRFYLPAQREGNYKSFLATIFWAAILGAAAVTFIAFLIAFVLRAKISSELYNLINIIILASFFNTFFEVYVVAFRAGLQPKKYAIYWILYSVGKPLLGIAMIFLFGMRVDGIFWAFLIVPFLLNFIMFHEFSLRQVLLTTRPSREMFSQLYHYGTQISLTFLAFWVLSFSDRYLIEYFSSTDQVGYYSVGYGISEKTLNFLYTALMLAAYPIIIDNWENHGKEHTQLLVAELLKYYLILFTPVLLVLVVMPENMLLLFADSKYLPGAQVLPLIAIGIFVYGLSQYAIKGFELAKKTRQIAVLAIIVCLLNVGLNLILIPRIGILGAGISSCVSYIVYFVMGAIGARFYLRLSLPWRTFKRILFASAVFAGVLAWGRFSASGFWLQLFVIAPVGLAAYFTILFVTGEINSSIFKMVSRGFRGVFAK